MVRVGDLLRKVSFGLVAALMAEQPWLVLTSETHFRTSSDALPSA